MTRQRSRELATPKPNLPGKRGVLLTDSERMPLQAAVDMLVLTVATEQRTGPVLDRELARITMRLQEAAGCRDGATRLTRSAIEALAGIGPVGGLSAAAAQHAGELAAILVDHGDTSDATWLTELVLAAPDQLSSAIGHEVGRLLRSEALRPAVAEAGRLWLASGRATWRENDAATGRDAFFSAMALRLAEAGHVDQAYDVAEAWPPMRTPLKRFVELVCAAGKPDRLVDLAKRYDSDGLLHRALIQALTAAAGTSDSGSKKAAAALFAIAPTLENAARMPSKPDGGTNPNTFALIENTLIQRDAPDAVTHIPDGPAGRDLMLGLIERFPNRGRTMKAIVRRLDRADPIVGFEARATWLTATIKTWPGSVSATRLRSMLKALRTAAIKAGEPALAEAVIETLRTNHDEPALLTILR